MMENKQIDAWKEELRNTHLPRWDELPDIEIYMDQLITLLDRYTTNFHIDSHQEKLVTASMVNNYVKQKLIPAPIKKKYNQRHLARLIVITILKQAFDIPAIKKGIEWQTHSGDYQTAYDQFCAQTEATIRLFLEDDPQIPFTLDKVEIDFLPIQMATITLTSKLVAEKSLNTLLSEMTINPKE